MEADLFEVGFTIYYLVRLLRQTPMDNYHNPERWDKWSSKNLREKTMLLQKGASYSIEWSNFIWKIGVVMMDVFRYTHFPDLAIKLHLGYLCDYFIDKSRGIDTAGCVMQRENWFQRRN